MKTLVLITAIGFAWIGAAHAADAESQLAPEKGYSARSLPPDLLAPRLDSSARREAGNHKAGRPSWLETDATASMKTGKHNDKLYNPITIPLW